MTTLRNTFALLFAGILPACAINDSTTPSPAKDLVVLSEEHATPAAPTFIMGGLLTAGHESQSFIPCASNKQFWAELQPDDLKSAMTLSQIPYQPMYAELVGHLKPTSVHGFDSDYEARFVVSSINFMTTENINRCDSEFRPTKVFGSEPFWSLEFDQHTARFQQMGEDSQSLTIASATLTPKKREYDFTESSLILEKSRCKDTMSDSMYGWSARFSNDDGNKNGCAILANKDATLAWSGTYSATSQSTTNQTSDGFDIELVLLPDHTATTTYRYEQSRPTTESGFWQQLNDDQVQVMMTHHQGQRLIAERIFLKNGNQLTTANEKIHGTLYPIANGGLTLYKNTP